MTNWTTHRAAWILSAVVVLIVSAMIGSLIAQAQSAPRAEVPENPYSLGFSQITIGASAGGSDTYAVEDSLKVGAVDAALQTSTSGTYAVTNPLGGDEDTVVLKNAVNAWDWNNY